MQVEIFYSFEIFLYFFILELCNWKLDKIFSTSKTSHTLLKNFDIFFKFTIYKLTCLFLSILYPPNNIFYEQFTEICLRPSIYFLWCWVLHVLLKSCCLHICIFLNIFFYYWLSQV